MDNRSRLIKISIAVSLASLLLALVLFLRFQPEQASQLVKESPKRDIQSFLPVGSSTRDLGEITRSLFSREDEADTDRGDFAITTSLGIKQITSNPIAGATSASLNGTSTIIYLDRQTGNLFSVDLSANKINRLTNTTRPATYDVYWGKDTRGLRLLMRSLKDNKIVNFSALLVTATASTTETEESLGEITGLDLGSEIKQVAVSPKGQKLFALAVNNAQESTGFTVDFDNKNQTKIWSSPASEFLVAWPTDNIIALTTKASAYLPGYLYFLDPVSGNFSKIIGNVQGLTTLVSPNGQKIIYSQSQARSFSSFLLDRNNSQNDNLGVKTLPEKCVWSKNSKIIYCGVPNVIGNNDYPDSWYRGEVKFHDSLWLINTETGEARNLYNTQGLAGDNGLDAINLFLDSTEKNLFFTDKATDQLWTLDLDR